MLIIFRTDASRTIGTGHISRCLNLARVLKSRGHNLVFVCSNKLPASIRRQVEEVSDLYIIDTPLAKSQTDSVEKNEKDEVLTVKAILGNVSKRIDFLVIDHYDIGEEWTVYVRDAFGVNQRRPFILTLDDLSNKRVYADLLLNQNILDSRVGLTRYRQITNMDCEPLVGPEFALLAREYSLGHKERRIRKEPIKRVLVCFGGSDALNITLLVVKALLKKLDKSIEIDVVLGPAFGHTVDVLRFALTESRITIHQELNCLAPLIMTADFGVGGGGVSAWERACLGLPSLVVKLAENQNDVISSLVEVNAAILLGSYSDLTDKSMEVALTNCLPLITQNLSVMSENSYAVLDGCGAERVAIKMESLGVSTPALRKAVKSDCEWWYMIANDAECRQASFSSKPINKVEHESWFSKKISDKSSVMLVAECYGEPIGYIRFDRSEKLDLIQERSIVVSIAIEKSKRGSGVGTAVLGESVVWIKRNMPGIRRIYAEVKPENRPSIRMFNRAGFVSTAPLRDESICLVYINSQCGNNG